MDFVFWLLVGLGVIAVVGHGLWVAVRATIRGLVGLFQGHTPQPVASETCPRCAEEWDRRLGSCFVCGWSPMAPGASARPEPKRALAALRRKVERLLRAGVLSDEAGQRLLQAIRAEDASAPALADRLRPQVPIPARQEARPVPPPSAGVLFLDERDVVADVPTTPSEETLPAVVGPATAEPEPTRAFGALLSGFLEEKNIRWGELVGGLLIVGCSLALVISFWSSIAERPFLKFGLFNGVTALLFLLGIHAERRWTLPTTARGLFVIATLLAPLNFLAVAAMARGTEAGSTWAVAGESGRRRSSRG